MFESGLGRQGARGLFAAALSALLFSGSPAFAAATSFGAVGPVGSLASADGPTAENASGDADPAVAGSPAGTVVAVWASNDSAAPGAGYSLLVSRSADSGKTWGPSVLLDPAAENYLEAYSDIATDGQGKWIVVFGRSGRTWITRSVDDALTWEAPVRIDGSMISSYRVSIEVGANGTWIAAWETDMSGDSDLYFVRSTDGGLSWSAPTSFTADDGSTGPDEWHVRLATDGAGTWVAVWDRNSSPYSSRSTDDGQTWSTQALLGTGATSSGARPDVAYDGNGSFVAVFVPLGYIPLGGGRILYKRSTDGGLTWSEPQAPLAMPEQNLTDSDTVGPRIVGIDGHLTAMWVSSRYSLGGSGGTDDDLLTADSYDGGITWDTPTLANLTGRFDSARDWRPALATVGTDDLVALWMSEDDLDGTIGTDWDILRVVSHADCPSVPAPGCLTAPSGSSRLILKDGSQARDKMSWRWRRGAETTPGDLGTPATTSAYALCLYAKADGSTIPVMENDIPAGLTCEGAPCWTASGDGFRYSDKETRHGAVASMRLTPGAEGQPSIDLRAKGGAIGLPSLPLDLSAPARVQLLNTETGTCWEATFSTASKNTSNSFAAKSD